MFHTYMVENIIEIGVRIKELILRIHAFYLCKVKQTTGFIIRHYLCFH